MFESISINSIISSVTEWSNAYTLNNNFLAFYDHMKYCHKTYAVKILKADKILMMQKKKSR
jgi:hypothetical protein